MQRCFPESLSFVSRRKLTSGLNHRKSDAVDLYKTCEDASEVTSAVSTRNMPWFAQFFVTEMVQICLDEEAAKAPADAKERKMSRLQRRMSQPDIMGSSSKGSSGGGNSRKQRKGGRLIRSHQHQKRSSQPPSKHAEALHSEYLGMFQDDEVFFYAFLVGSSSVMLSTHLRRVIATCIDKLCRQFSAASAQEFGASCA